MNWLTSENGVSPGKLLKQLKEVQELAASSEKNSRRDFKSKQVNTHITISI